MDYKQIIFSNSSAKEVSTGAVKVIYEDGTIEYLVDGEYHRVGGPSVEGADKSRWYHEHGELHRTAGKAIIHHNEFFSDESFFLRGKKYDRISFMRMLSRDELLEFLLNSDNF